MVFVALLRGINLGGHRKIKMDALRDVCASLDFADARTHIQSGNIVFRSSVRKPAAVSECLEKAIEEAFGFHSDVILRTLPEMRCTVANNPFRDRTDINPARLLVTFLASKPSAVVREQLMAANAPEQVRMIGREVYIYYPNGMSISTLPVNFIDKAAKVPATGRNWNTVTKLLIMAEECYAGR